MADAWCFFQSILFTADASRSPKGKLALQDLPTAFSKPQDKHLGHALRIIYTLNPGPVRIFARFIWSWSPTYPCNRNGCWWRYLASRHSAMKGWCQLLLQPSPADEAPAKTVSEKTAALAAEHGKTFAKQSMGSFGISASNVPGLNYYLILCFLLFVNMVGNKWKQRIPSCWILNLQQSF